MAFPTTGIIDDFNRGNEGPPLSGDWTDGNDGHKVVSNEAQPETNSTACLSFYNASTYGADCECYVTLADAFQYQMACFLRATTLVEASWDGYEVYADDNGSELTLERVDNNSETEIGTPYDIGFDDGDKIGIEAIGSTIKAYMNDGGAGWVERVSTTDGAHGNAGYLGLWSWTHDTSQNEYDDFGGGTIAAGGLSIPLLMQQMDHFNGGFLNG